MSISVAVVPALIALTLTPMIARANTYVRGCTDWIHGRSSHDARCAGTWFQAGPGADGYGGTLMYAVTPCASSPRARCTRMVSRAGAPVIGVYVDDTTPCPASLDGALGTWYSARWDGWFGAPCVEYWINDEREHNPAHGLIYAAIGYCGCIDGGLGTRFAGADATLVEWYPFSMRSFAGFPPRHEQGYILQYSYDAPPPRAADILWSWGEDHAQGVLAYY